MVLTNFFNLSDVHFAYSLLSLSYFEQSSAYENVKLNKLKGDVISLNGDSTAIINEQLQNKADRVLMLLPERSDEFLDTAISSLKKNGFIHYYSHIHAEKKQDAPKLSEDHFLSINKTHAKIISSKNVRPIGPRFYQTVIDVKIQKN